MRTNVRVLVISACVCCVASAAAANGGRRREYEPYVFAAVPLHAPVPVLHVLSPAPLTEAPLGKLPRPSVRHTTPFTRPYVEPRPYESRPYTESRPYLESRPYIESSRPHARIRPYAIPYEPVELEETASSEYVNPSYSHRPIVRPTPEYAAEYEYALQVFPSSLPRVTLAHQAPPDAAAPPSAEDSSQEAPTVLYARPSLSGGYTYRKISNKKTPPKKVASSKEVPVIIKIHKHKITKS